MRIAKLIELVEKACGIFVVEKRRASLAWPGRLTSKQRCRARQLDLEVRKRVYVVTAELCVNTTGAGNVNLPVIVRRGLSRICRIARRRISGRSYETCPKGESEEEHQPWKRTATMNSFAAMYSTSSRNNPMPCTKCNSPCALGTKRARLRSGQTRTKTFCVS